MKSRLLPILSVCVASFTFGLAQSKAAIIAKFNFDTDEGNVGDAGTFAMNSTAANVTSTGFSFGSGASTSSTNSAAPASTTDFSTILLIGGSTTTSQATARANNAYGQFTLDANPTYSLNLRNQALTFELAKGGASGTRQIFVEMSLDGFATLTPDSVNTFTVGGPTTATDNTAFQSVSYTMPDVVALESLAGAVTFRFYSFHNGTNLSVRLDDVIVNGSVIPEPSAPLMLISSLGTCALLRRRRA